VITPEGQLASDEDATAAGADGPASLVAQIERDIATLDNELTEIEMLIVQASAESERHEAKRAALAARIDADKTAGRVDPMELAEQNAQLVGLTRRAIVMGSQVDVLNGKVKILRRYRDSLASLDEQLHALPDGGLVALPADVAGDGEGGEHGGAGGAGAGDVGARLSPAVSRLILAAQEDLRRDIARAMHDGPAQSLTNIVLQAQIVDRLIASDPAAAKPEIRELIAMVQTTLDTTKSFIFDVRPMVLDDLGLVPTVRRSARDRGRRANIPVDFDSMGPDRRLPMDLESGVFRMIEESLAAYLAGRPERVVVRLDWTTTTLETIVRSMREPAAGIVETPEPAAPAESDQGRGRSKGKDRPEPAIPAALAAMISERRDEHAAAVAATTAPVALPLKTWHDVQARAASLGARAELSSDGSEVRMTTDLPAAD
jgi:two-component system sensor histidine kinase DegS